MAKLVQPPVFFMSFATFHRLIHPSLEDPTLSPATGTNAFEHVIKPWLVHVSPNQKTLDIAPFDNFASSLQFATSESALEVLRRQAVQTARAPW